METLKTRNAAFGFYATAQSNFNLNGAEQYVAWSAAMDALIKHHAATPEDARNFLDSRYGRHFADSLTFNSTTSVLDAIAAYKPIGWVAKELRKIATPAVRAEFDFDAQQRGEE